MPQKKSHRDANIMTARERASRPREQREEPQPDFSDQKDVTRTQKIGAPGEEASGPEQRISNDGLRAWPVGPTRVAQPATRSSMDPKEGRGARWPLMVLQVPTRTHMYS